METEAFCVFDSKAERYLEPFFAPTAAVAIRGFQDAVRKPGHPFNEHPEDYTLFHIGGFDAEQGMFRAETPRTLGNGIRFVENSDVLPFGQEVKIADS